MPKGHSEGSKATQFQPGNNANPGGRPKGFAAKIKDLCGEDYGKIAQGLYLIAFGTAQERSSFFGERVQVTTKDRIAAAIALRDSGPGRPAQAITGPDGGTFHLMTKVIHEHLLAAPQPEIVEGVKVLPGEISTGREDECQ